MGKFVSWASRHKIVTAFLAVSAVGIIGSAIAGPSTPAPAAKAADASKSAPSAHAAAPAAPAVDADTAAARGWIHKSAHYTNEVQVAVQSVQASLALIQGSGGGSGTADAAALSANLGQAHDFLDDASVFLVGVIEGHMKTQRQEAWYAADELKDAVGKARSYLDDQKPSELADFQTKFSEGVQYWNEAVTTLYAKAGIPKPPTI